MQTWISAAAIGQLLIVATIWDLRKSEIPGLLTIGGLAAGVVVRSVLGPGIATSLIGAGVGGGLLLVFVLLGGIGAGDAWLLAAIGAWSDWRFVLAAAVWTGVVGGAMAAIVYVSRRFGLASLRAFPYVPAIAAGTLIAWLAG